MLAQVEQSLRRGRSDRRHRDNRCTQAFTARPQEILDLVAAGDRSAEIAGRLGVGPSPIHRITCRESQDEGRNRLHAAAGRRATSLSRPGPSQRAEPVAVGQLDPLTGDEERDGRFLDNLRWLREIERYRPASR